MCACVATKCGRIICVCNDPFLFVIVQERFEAVFSVPPLRWVFSDSSGSLHEWWFRLQLDRHVSGNGTFLSLIHSV